MKHDQPLWPYFVNLILVATFISVILLIAGCAYLGNAWQKGAEANDSALNAAHAVTCEGASIGSVKRRYGGSEQQAKIYDDFCGTNGQVIK